MSDQQYARFWLRLFCLACGLVVVHVLTGCTPLPLDAPPEAVASDVQYSALWGGAFMLVALAVVRARSLGGR